MFDPLGPVLGIDPGLSRCGYGIVARERGNPRALGCGVIRTPPGDSLPDRLLALDDDLRQLVAQVRPSAMAVERVLFQSNARTAMSVGQASGLALVVAARAGVAVAQYSPNEVKLAVQTMVTRLLALREIPKPADAADALALACCHHGRTRMLDRIPS